uniref:RRM domain-containing protein n=1 Tax=Hyaloperonospora arabidopsidis (strain Emoy2) TaxID=559515 RepID=M4C338_HYAAE
MNVVAEIQRLNERELELNVPLSGSWHQKYRDSAWIFLGGLSFELSEGDVLCVLSQFGEVEDLHLVRDGKTGKSKGFAFVKYEDQRSTILAVDNLNNWKLLDRVLRVDHVLKYKLPKELQEGSDSEDDESAGKERRPRGLPGHAYEGKELASEFDLQEGVNVFAATKEKQLKKDKKEKKKKKDKKHGKKAKILSKKVMSNEQKQQQVVEQVLQKRREQRLKEEREAVQKGVEEVAPQPSATGWRGRLEPSVVRPRCDVAREQQENGGQENQRYKSYGGMSRTR